MSTIEQEPIIGELIESRAVDRLPVLFSVTDAEIEKLRNESFGLTVHTIGDYQHCTKLIAIARKMRGMTRDCKDELKKDVLTFGRRVDAEHNRIIAKIEAIETPLQTEKKKYDDAKELAKKQEAEAKQRALQVRIDALALVGNWTNPLIVETWSVEQYDEAIETARQAWDTKLRKECADKAEASRIEWERVEAIRQEKIKLDAERIEMDKQRAAFVRQQLEQDAIAKAEREAIEAERKAIQVEQAKIDEQNQRLRDAVEADRKAFQAERDRIDQEEKERQQAIELERLSKEKYERDLAHAIECQALVAEQDRLAAIRIADEAARIEALKPDVEKLKILGDTLRLLAYPEMSTDEGAECLRAIVRRIGETAEICSECLS